MVSQVQFLRSSFLVTALLALTIISLACAQQKGPIDTLDQTIRGRIDYADLSGSIPVDFVKIYSSTNFDGIPIRTVVLGPVDFPTGSLVACDPYYVAEDSTAPFSRTINPGEYSVHLTMADFGDWGERVALARLVINDSDVERWELATTTAEGGDLFTNMYGVDGGMGILADQQAASLLAESMESYYESNPDGNYYEERLAAGFDEDLNYNIFQPSPRVPLFVPVFSTGLGDGAYSSYWGLDRSGAVVTLLTDFQLFDSDGHVFQ